MSFVAILIYFPPMMQRTNGQTLGKIAMAIRVVRTDGRPMTLARAAWRESIIKDALFFALGLIPAIGGFLAFLDVLNPIHDKENRAIHDLLARTHVVKCASD